jgi:hypothetical protein
MAALLVAGATTVLVAAACSAGSTSSSASGGGGENGAGGNNAFAAYSACLQKNGVTITRPSGAPRVRRSGEPRAYPSGMPRPSGSAGARAGGFPGGGFGRPPGVDDATWQKAMQACASLRPSGRPGFRGGIGNGADAAYRNCLRDHGVTLGQGGLNTADPATAKALETCKVLRPTATATPTS